MTKLFVILEQDTVAGILHFNSILTLDFDGCPQCCIFMTSSKFVCALASNAPFTLAKFLADKLADKSSLNVKFFQ